MNKLVVFSILSVAAWSHSSSAASYSYTIIAPAGVNQLYALGINDAGQVFGYYFDAGQKKDVGFIYTEGNFVNIAPPEQNPPNGGSILHGIGPTGTVVGDFGLKLEAPFIFSPGGTSEKLEGGLHGVVTPAAVNSKGDVVGSVHAGGLFHAFLDHDGISLLLDPPGSLGSVRI